MKTALNAHKYQLKNLKTASYIVCGYAVICTGLITLLAARELRAWRDGLIESDTNVG